MRSSPPSPPLATYTEAMFLELCEHGQVDYEDLVAIGIDHVPPGVAIRNYRRLADWRVGHLGVEHPAPMPTTDTQIRSGARRIVVKAVWQMVKDGAASVDKSNGRKTVAVTEKGRERFEKHRSA